jgi:hypothetical protein
MPRKMANGVRPGLLQSVFKGAPVAQIGGHSGKSVTYIIQPPCIAGGPHQACDGMPTLNQLGCYMRSKEAGAAG